MSAQITLRDIHLALLSRQFQLIDSTRKKLFRQFQLLDSLLTSIVRTIPIDSLRDPLSEHIQIVESLQYQLSGQFQLIDSISIVRTIPIGGQSPEPIASTIPINIVYVYHVHFIRHTYT